MEKRACKRVLAAGMAGILVWMLGSLAAVAPVYSAASGGQPGQFLQWGAGARSFGMGTAFFSVADDASATYWNPAGLPQLDRKELTTLGASLFPGSDSKYYFMSMVYPTPEMGVFGVNLISLETPGFQKVSVQWNPQREIVDIIGGEEFSDINRALSISYGRKVLENISVGIAVKHVTRTLDVYTDSMLTTDITMLARGVSKKLPSLNLAFGLKNLIKMEIGENTDDTLPMIIRMGGSYRMLKDKLLMALDLESNMAAGAPSWAFGMEYNVLNSAAVRFGFNGESGGGFRETDIGFGIKYKDYGFDYAFAIHEMGASHRFSGTMKFGKSVIQNRESLVKRLVQEATEAYRKGDFLVSYNKLEQAFGIDPTNRETDRMITALKEVMAFIPRARADTEEEGAIRKGVASYVENDVPGAVNAFRYAYYKNPDNQKLLDMLNSIEKANNMAMTEKFREEIGGLTIVDKKLYDARRAVIDGKYDQSLARCQEILNLEPANTTAMEIMGSAFFMMNRHDKAKEVWLKVLEVDPTNRVVKEFLDELD